MNSKNDNSTIANSISGKDDHKRGESKSSWIPAEGDASQGSEYLDDALRMTDLPLKTTVQLPE